MYFRALLSSFPENHMIDYSYLNQKTGRTFILHTYPAIRGNFFNL